MSIAMEEKAINLNWLQNGWCRYRVQTATMRSLRLRVILIAVHQFTISFICLLVLLLGLTHVSEMTSRLCEDMHDQAMREEQEEYETALEQGNTNVSPPSSGHEVRIGGCDHDYVKHHSPVSNNRLRMLAAKYLASMIRNVMYAATLLALVYSLACVSLLVGAIRRLPNLISCWLMVYLPVCAVFLAALWAAVNAEPIVRIVGGENHFLLVAVTITAFNIIIWIIVREYNTQLNVAIKSLGLKEPSVNCKNALRQLEAALCLTDNPDLKIVKGSCGYKHGLLDSSNIPADQKLPPYEMIFTPVPKCDVDNNDQSLGIATDPQLLLPCDPDQPNTKTTIPEDQTPPPPYQQTDKEDAKVGLPKPPPYLNDTIYPV